MSLIFQKPPFNYQYKVGISNLLDIVALNQSIAGPQTNAVISTLVVPPSVLVLDGQLLLVRYYGRLSNPNGALVLRAQFFSPVGTLSLTLVNASKAAVAGTTTFLIELQLYRNNAQSGEAQARVYYNMASNTSTPVAVTPLMTGSAFAANWSIEQALTLDLTEVAGDSLNLRQVYAVAQ